MTLYPRYRNIAAYGILFDQEPTNNLFGQPPGDTLGSYEVPQEDLDYLATYAKCNEPDVNNCKGSWQKGQGEIIRNDGRSYQAGCLEVKPNFEKAPPGKDEEGTQFMQALDQVSCRAELTQDRS